MEDARGGDDSAVIGENLQSGKPLRVRHRSLPATAKPTGNFVTDYATEALRTCLKGWGVTENDGPISSYVASWQRCS